MMCWATLVGAQADVADRQGSVIEQVIVTAQKRAENLQDVPISINAISADVVAASGVHGTTGIASLTSGVVITDVTGAPSVTIRGIGTQNTFAGEESSNSMYVDGVYYSSISASAFSLASLERIEILKGPQGTLFGRNATGGLIHIITRDPTHDPTLEMSLGYGNYDTSSASLYGSAGLSDSIAADLSVNYLTQGDGYGVNLSTGEDTYRLKKDIAVRSKLLWDLSDDTRAIVAADYSDSDSTLASPRSIIPGAVALDGGTYVGDRFDVRNEQRGHGFATKNKGASLRLDHSFSSMSFTSLTAYREFERLGTFDQDGSAAGLINVSYDQSADQTTQEFQLQSVADDKLNWIVGAFYLDSTEGVHPLGLTGLTQAAAGGFSNLFSELETQSVAGYAQTTLDVASDTSVTAGVRYTRDEKAIVGRNVTGAPVNPIRNVTDAERNWSELTYRLAVDHALTDDVMAYASWNRGFKSGGFNGSNLTNPPIDPETLDAYEIGLKSELFDHTVRANLSTFYYDYAGVQLSQVVVGTQLIVNAARATSYGLEGDFIFSPMDNLDIRANFSLVHGEYDDFPNAPAALANPVTVVPPGYACPATLPTSAGGNTRCIIADASGHRMIQTPERTLSLGANYTIPSAVGNFNADLSYYYNSGYFYEVDNRVSQPSYRLVNAQLSWTSSDDRYAVRLWGKNLSDEEYYTNISTSVGDNGTWAAPRTYGISFDVKL